MNTHKTIIVVLALLMLGCSGGGSPSSVSVEAPEPVPLSSDTSLASVIGEVRGHSLVEIPFGTTVEVLEASLVVAAGARFDICESDGRTRATGLTASSLIVVTAEDGTRATYTVSILPDPAIVAEWIGFSPDCRQYVIADVPAVEGYKGNMNARLFDGDPATLDYVIAPDRDELTLRNKGTVEVLVRVDGIHPFAGIVHKGERRDFSDEAWGLQLWYHEGSHARLLFMITGDDGKWIGVYGSYDLQPGRWYHIVGTWDETTLRLYVNGVLDDEAANTTGGVRDTAGSLIIGAQLAEKYNAGYGNLGWDGVIDRVIIRSDTLSAEQVQARYNGL
ncbi:MAG: hypothetical protein A4E67_00797 [Syntrophaceae bacterium PtaB.Bin038]|nr:MAG: hypothetical protein A4E67_00797 [Syntrophaceae bacterium PtaB.Bin038]